MLYSIIVSLLFGLLAIFPPYLGFLYSGKIIKEFEKRGLLKGSIVFFISAILISFVFSIRPMILVFFSIYGISIAFYFLLRKFNFGNWDKAFITTIVSILIGAFILIYEKVFFLTLKDELVKQVMNTVASLDKSVSIEDINLIIRDFFDKLLIYTVVFIFFSHLLTYIVVNKKDSLKWELSYVFIIIYILTFLYGKYGIDNYYVRSLRESVQFIYMIYGMKEFYIKIREKLKLKFLTLGITMLLYTLEPFIFFIYGALRSFKLVKKNEEEKDV